MDIKDLFRAIIFGNKETPKKYGLAFAFALGIFCIMALPSYLGAILPSHWWNTLNLPETSGQVILKQLKKEPDYRSQIFKIELVGLDDAPSLSYNETEYGGRIDMWPSDVDSTCLDYAKVWDILERVEINDTIAVKYVTNRNGEQLFTQINNVENIGFFGDDGGFYFSLFFTLTCIPFAFLVALNGEAALPYILEMRSKRELNDET